MKFKTYHNFLKNNKISIFSRLNIKFNEKYIWYYNKNKN